ncbi:MAG: phosphodiesterase [Eubacteriales bacterium]
MKIGILSDSHGSAAAWEAAVSRFFSGCSLIIHAGDVLYHGPRNPLPDGHNPQKLAELINQSPVPVIFAKGNCDAEIDSVLLKYPVQAPYAMLYVKGKAVLVTHGQEMDTAKMKEMAGLYGAGIVISGHTHIPRLEQENETLFLNPGSCALPKSSEGPTVAIWEGNTVSILSMKDGHTVKAVEV